jgi:hypothetical protein
MKTLATLLLLALTFTAQAGNVITATIAVTNAAGTTNGNSITVNGDTRIWTNAVTTPATQILNATNPALAATALLNHAAVYTFTNLYLGQTTATNITLRSRDGGALDVVLSNGWGTVTLVTNVLTSAVALRLPITVEAESNRVNLANELLDAFRFGVSNVTFNGSVTGSNATFSGTVTASNATLQGTVTAATLIAGNSLLTNNVQRLDTNTTLHHISFTGVYNRASFTNLLETNLVLVLTNLTAHKDFRVRFGTNGNYFVSVTNSASTPIFWSRSNTTNGNTAFRKTNDISAELYITPAEDGVNAEYKYHGQ